jgi:DNA-binding transcriptional ArsR family regulator
MARAPTTLDTFSAIAEPKRRQVLGALAKLGTAVGGGPGGSAGSGGGELQVNDLVKSLGWPQPQVSKHLAVLRQVGLVRVRRRGRTRLYRVNGEQLKPIHDWVKSFERFWTHHLERIKERAEKSARAAKSPHQQE